MASSDKICDHCNKVIEDEVVVALGKCWHREHFLCAHCKKPLKDAKYIEVNGQAYCEPDWEKLFKIPSLPKCAHCNKPITEKLVDALGKTWHKEHFVCAHCKKPFEDSKFYTDNGLPYCEADFKKLFKEKPSGKGQTSRAQASESHPVCAECKKPITEDVVTAMGKTWHKEHFVCDHCKKPFNGSSFSVEDGKPYCEVDYKKLFKGKGKGASSDIPNCAYCNKPITDAVLMALEKSWHKDHFVCAHCKNPINTSDFRAHDGKPYCDKDYNMLFRKKCSGCREMIQGTVVTALNKHWHKQCFSCSICKEAINAQEGFTENNGKPFCLTCTGG